MLGAKRRQRQRLVIALVIAGALVALSVIVSVAQAGGLDDDFGCADTAVAHGRSPAALTTKGAGYLPSFKANPADAIVHLWHTPLSRPVT